MVFTMKRILFHLLAFNHEMFLAPKAILELSRIAQSKSLSWNSESERLYCERLGNGEGDRYIYSASSSHYSFYTWPLGLSSRTNLATSTAVFWIVLRKLINIEHNIQITPVLLSKLSSTFTWNKCTTLFNLIFSTLFSAISKILQQKIQIFCYV